MARRSDDTKENFAIGCLSGIIDWVEGTGDVPFYSANLRTQFLRFTTSVFEKLTLPICSSI